MLRRLRAIVSMPLVTMRYHVATDITSRITRIALPSESVWARKCAKPSE